MLSPSTEEYDRGDKLDHYRRLPSLRQVVLVLHDARELEVWTRDESEGWRAARVGDGGVAELASIGCTLDVTSLHDAAL